MNRIVTLLLFTALLLATPLIARAEESPTSPVISEVPALTATETVEAAYAKVTDALKIGPGEGYLKFGLLLQGWYAASIFQKNAALGLDRDWTNTFRLRRAEFSVKGQIVPKAKEGGVGLGYNFMVNPGKLLEKDVKLTTIDTSATTYNAKVPTTWTTVDTTMTVASGALSWLQDYSITLLTDYADVSIGQFKTPLSWEGFNSSSELLFAERAYVSRALGDKRDLGIKIDKRIGPVYYNVSLFNGAGQNRIDTDTNKDLAARFEFYPLTLARLDKPVLMVGGALYMTLRTAQARPLAKDRWEADLRLDFKPIVVQAEYIRARDYDAKAARTTAQGFYAAVAGTITDNWQLAARFGGYDQDVDDTDPSKTWLWEATGGLHWYPLGNFPYAANLKLDYSLLLPKVESTKLRTEHQVILAMQLKF